MKLLRFAGVVSLLLAGPVQGATEIAQGQDLTELSLQELLNVQVTSVSKHAEPLRRAAAAIFVLNGDEIRRSGVRTKIGRAHV